MDFEPVRARRWGLTGVDAYHHVTGYNVYLLLKMGPLTHI